MKPWRTSCPSADYPDAGWRSAPLGRASARTVGRGMEIVGLGADPCDEAGEFGIVAQALGVGEVAGDLGLGVAGVDGRMADLVQAHGLAAGASLELGDQVVEGGFRSGRNGAVAEDAKWCFGRRDRVGCGGGCRATSHGAEMGCGSRIGSGAETMAEPGVKLGC